MGFACAGVGMAFGVGAVHSRKETTRCGHRPAQATSEGRAHADDIGRPSSIDVRRLHRRGVEADGRDRHLLPGRGSLLGRLRAGRIDAESVRRSLHPPRCVGLLVPLVVVPVRPADLRDHPRACVRVDLDEARTAGAFGACEVRGRARLHEPRLSRDRARRRDGAERRRRPRESLVADRVVRDFRDSASCASAPSA